MEFLNNRRFRRQVRETAESVFNTGREAGFVVWRNKKLRYSPVYEGFWNMVVLPSFPLELEITEALHWEGIGRLHFHPHPDGVIIPSENDLSGFITDSPRTWEIIGRVDLREVITLLVLERGDKIVTPSDLCGWGEKTDPFAGLPEIQQEVVNSLLTQIGFRVSSISFQARNLKWESEEEF